MKGVKCMEMIFSELSVEVMNDNSPCNFTGDGGGCRPVCGVLIPCDHGCFNCPFNFCGIDICFINCIGLGIATD